MDQGFVRRLLPLTSDETAFKAEWEKGNSGLWASAFTYAQYEAYLKDGICVMPEADRFFPKVTEEELGNTVIELGPIFDGEEIIMSRHPRYRYPVLHNHEFIEMLYVYSGSCTQFVEEKQFSLNRGDVCILAPHAMHAITAMADDALVFNIMLNRQIFDRGFMDLLSGGMVLKDFFEDLLYEREYVSPYVIFPTGDDEQIRTLVEQMYTEMEKKQYAYQRGIFLMTQSLFILLIRNYEMAAIISAASENSFNNHIVSILGYLSINYNCTTLNQTAAFFGYAPGYLGKMLKRFTGKSYTDIILEYQMENACRLLKQGTISITEISQQIGCFDASHFVRKFKKRFGLSPAEYRDHSR